MQMVSDSGYKNDIFECLTFAVLKYCASTPTVFEETSYLPKKDLAIFQATP